MEFSKRWNEEFEKKLHVWRSLSKEERDKVVEKVLEKFQQLASKDPRVAGIEFYKWLSSPDGAIVWPYLFREEFRGIIVDITRHLLEIAHKAYILGVMKK